MNDQLQALLRDGPAPRLEASQRGPLRATRWACGGGGSSSSQSQSSDTNDSRVGVDGNNATIVKDATLGNVTITTLDGEVAQNALNTAGDLAETGSNTAIELARTAYDSLKKLVESNQAVALNALNSAGDVAAGSLAAATAANSEASARAAEVAASQSKFLATQTGQTSLVSVIKFGAVAAVGLVVVGGIALATIGRKKAA